MYWNQSFRRALGPVRLVLGASVVNLLFWTSGAPAQERAPESAAPATASPSDRLESANPLRLDDQPVGSAEVVRSAEPLRATGQSPAVARGDCACGAACNARGCRAGGLFGRQLAPGVRPAHNLRPPRVPLGATVFAPFQTQVDNGVAGQLVLYRFDFHNEQNSDHSRLNPYGVRRLRRMAALLSFSGLPLIVEETVETPKLNAARREQVIQALAEMSLPVDPQRVVLGEPPVHGLDGTEAPLIYENLLRQTVNGPSGVSASGAGGSGLTGATSFGVEGTQ